MRVLFLPTDNRTDSNRTARSIDQLVVHVTVDGLGGSFITTVASDQGLPSRSSAASFGRRLPPREFR
jgi:hypothetical protein